MVDLRFDKGGFQTALRACEIKKTHHFLSAHVHLQLKRVRSTSLHLPDGCSAVNALASLKGELQLPSPLATYKGRGRGSVV